MNPQLEQALTGFLDQPDDPVEGALVAARIINAQADVEWARDELHRLAADLPGDSGAEIVAELGRRGFAGADERHFEVDNNRIDHVLRTRRGIPISLGVICIGLARRRGVPAAGVNFPRHFLVTVRGALLDPYALAPTSLDSCRTWLRENDMREDGAFDVAEPRDILQRMLNNARVAVHDRGDYARSLDISDYQLVIAPRSYALHVERADAWLGLEAPEMVASELALAIEHAPAKRIAERLQQRLARVRRLRKSVVH